MRRIMGPPARLSIVTAAVWSLSAGAVHAQTTPAAGTTAEAPQRITITGSNIKRIDSEGVAPLQVITADDIKRSGLTTITDVLRSISSAAGGGLTDTSGSASFSAGASSVSLRGLGSAATLVLLNGRRVAPFAPADPNFGQASAVNLDALPFDVIDRIEVLKDGASAIYGSEAIAGVVNIITKQDFNGGFVQATGATNERGNYQSSSFSITAGVGDLAQDKYNVFATLEYLKRDRTSFESEQDWLIDKRFTASPFFRTGDPLFSSYAGNYYNAVFDPSTLGSAFYYEFLGPSDNCPAEQIDAGGRCRFNIWPYQDIIPKSERLNFFSRGTLAINANLSAFAEVAYNKVKSSFSSAPQVYGDFGSWFASGTGQIVNIPEVLPPGHPSNPTGDYIGYRHRFTEVGPANATVDLSALRIVAGLTGTTAAWDWEAAFAYSDNKSSATNFNQIRTSAITDGVINGTYNFLDPESGVLKPADLRIDTTDKAKSSYYMLDLKGSRELMQMPGGPLALAAGIEVRREDRSTTPDVAKEIGEVVGFGTAAADGTRNVYSGYAELSVPITSTLEAQLAARMDRYSDYGSSVNPKLGLSWKAAPELRLRGSYQTGYRAPSLTEIAKSDVSAFTTILDPKRCVTGLEDDCGGTNIGIFIASNPDLKPEKSRGYNFGIILEPMKDLSTSIDYFRIERRNEVDTLSLDEIITNEDSTDPKYAGRITRGPADPNDPTGRPGPIQTITTGYFNLGKTVVAGIDVDARFTQRLAEYGKLTYNAKATLYTVYKGSSDAVSPLVSSLGYNNTPRTRASYGVDWEYADFTTSLRINHVGKYKTYNPIEFDAEQCDAATLLAICQVGAWETVDIGVGYTGFKNMEIQFGIENVGGKRPPVDPNTYSLPAFNADFHNPFGRAYTLSIRYDFL